MQNMSFDAGKEIGIISKLLSEVYYNNYSIERIFNTLFKYYPLEKKHQFTSYEEMKTYFMEMEIDEYDRLFVFLEFIIDLFYTLTEGCEVDVTDGNNHYTGSFMYEYDYWFDYDEFFKQFFRIEDRINYFLNKTNHDLITLKNGNKIIVEKNVYASEVSQIVSETSIQDAIKVLEYNHFANKGNIQRKKEILISLAGYLEPYLIKFDNPKKLPKELKEIYNELKIVLQTKGADTNKKGEKIPKKIAVFDNLSEMYNQGGLRHNNDKQYHLNMNDEELEQWYDNIYTSTLFVILSLEMGRNLSKLNELKKK